MFARKNINIEDLDKVTVSCIIPDNSRIYANDWSGPETGITTSTTVTTDSSSYTIKTIAQKAEEAERAENIGWYNESVFDYLLEDIIDEKARQAEKDLDKAVEEKNRHIIKVFRDNIIKRVIFSGNRTVVIFRDGQKVIVTCQPGEKFDKEKGLALAIIKYFFGNTNYYNEIFKKFIEDEDE